jgi:hypothetical protein
MAFKLAKTKDFLMILSSGTTTRLVLFLVLVGVSIFALMYSRSAPAAPTVTWTPASLSAEVAAGQSSTTSATFTASANATNATVWVVPEIAPYVTVTPSTFASLTKGASYTVQVTFAPPATTATGTYDGTIHLRQSEKTLAKPLPAQLRVVWPTFDGSRALGITIKYPPGWYVDTTSENTVAFSNIAGPPSKREDYAFFRLRRLVNVNSLQLPIEQWFNEYFSRGFSSAPTSKKFPIVAGRDAVRIEVIDVGVHVVIYLPDGKDVIALTYELDNPDFIADYEAMSQSLSFAE